MSGGPAKDLYPFLVEAELEQYYNSFKTDLKITSVTQIKYIEDEDLIAFGMSKPEMRRLRKFFKKECPQGTFGKLKKIISTKTHSSYNIDHSVEPETRRSPTHVRVPSKHIISPDAISVNKTIGQGEFGTVQQGIWTNEDGERIQVAIKGLSKERMHTGLTEFLKEATNMHTIDHEHIVRLYGVVIDGESLMLVTELAPLRSLLECLKEPSLHASFPVSTLCNFSVQVADGMSYLEGKRLIHRDLAARNILVFTKDKVKISDFGLSRALGVGKDYYQTNFNVNLKLPIAWCAPESINYLKFTSSSDVWSYGVTLWEMFSYGFQPWAGLTGQQILDSIDEPNHHRLEQPECCPRDYYNLMLKCWDADPKRRPKFCELVLSLPQIKPETVKAIKDSSNTSKEFLFYKSGDLITVLDKRPPSDPNVNVWRGVTANGKTGFFSPSDITMFTLDTASPHVSKSTKVLLRKESSVRKGRSGSMIRKDMISNPANDLRHTGHIGYDGAVFGDVSFIGDNYDKLPVKVVNPYKPQDDMVSASPPLSKSPDKVSAPIPVAMTETSTEKSWKNSDPKLNMDDKPDYDEINEDDFDGFKTPDFSLNLDLDFGTSFMDDFMKAFDGEDAPSQPSGSLNNSQTNSRETTPENETPKEDSSNGDDVGLHASMTPRPMVPEKRKSRLRIMIPKSEKKQAKVKPLSASDEKQLDSAIELANQFDALNTGEVIGSPKTPKSPWEKTDSEHECETPGRKGKFSFKLKKSSPKPERRTFIEEMESKKDDDILSPEAEEAYNMLVVKGSVRQENTSSFEDLPINASPKSSPRSVPRGVATAITQQPSPRGGSPRSSRRPEISGPIITGQSTTSINSSTRGDSASPKPPARVESLNDSDSSENENKGQSRRFLREQRVRRSMEHQRNSLSDHSDNEKKEKNLKQPSGIPSRDTTDSSEMDTNPLRRLRDGGNIMPVPRPRNARQGGGRSAIIPMTDNGIRAGAKTQSFVRDRGAARPRLPERENDDTTTNPLPLPPKRGSIKQPVLPDTSKPVKPSSLPLPLNNDDSDKMRSSPLPKRFNLQNVKCNPEQLGIHNDWDLFWTKNVKFEAPMDEDGMPTMNAKYKTSENVSYEDLLDFAMDDEKYSAEQKDQVQELQKVLSKQVMARDCLEALEATEFNFQKAVKYIKLKQLLSLQLGDVNRCKEALMRCKWRIEEAADYLLNNPLPSPECVDV